MVWPPARRRAGTADRPVRLTGIGPAAILLAALLTAAVVACQPPGTGQGPAGQGPADSPRFESASLGQQNFRIGDANPVVTLPAARGGGGVLRYRLTPQVPGLEFDARSRRLTATPEAFGYHVMTYEVIDADGDAARLQFAIAVGGKECAACPEMVVVPPGSYVRTSRTSIPDAPVTIARPFAVGAYEVTFDEWDACVNDGGCDGHEPGDATWGRGRRPVIHVNWYDARRYATWLTGETGREYRLLSEAEWQYAARAGTTTFWHTGTSITTNQANFGRSEGPTEEVGSYDLANAFGLYDVHGNVKEWALDCYSLNWEGAPRDGSPWYRDSCRDRAVLGGSYADPDQFVRSDAREGIDPSQRRHPNLGFRVARTLEAPSVGE